MTPKNGHARPTAHVWKYLSAYGDEEPGYATYSYVLVGSDEENPEVAARYLALTKAIRASTAGADSLPKSASLENFNLFLVPAKIAADGTIHEPNYALAKALLAALATTSPLNFSKPGPYIITLYKPICFGEDGEIADILYVDFTNIHTAAIPEVVRTYKNKVLATDLRGIERLKSLRLSLLNLALIAEDSIGFAQTAYAEMKKAFPD